MPKDNVERAIKKGTGELTGEKLEEVIFEGFGPAGIAIIIEAITDNKNRTISDVKQIFNQNNGKLAGEGAVQWMFERKGIISVDNKEKTMKKEQLELAAIESGAEDLYLYKDILNIYTKPEDLEKVKSNLEKGGIKIKSSFVGLSPKDAVAIDEKTKESCQKLFEALDENDAVQEIYSNIKD
ncbi:YebC/PmpR family DNA-binding transcriptional regulator, partial [Patescibacteria group bacterium]|nr:YebC/PmpR family DNA-binding transcriptional regulator [Patescibacteria group bacterium]